MAKRIVSPKRETKSAGEAPDLQCILEASKVTSHLGAVPLNPKNKFEYVTLDRLNSLFGCGKAIIDDLTAQGFSDPSSLRFQLETGMISKTRRGFAAINVYRDQDMVTGKHRTTHDDQIQNMAARYLAKTTNTGEQVAHDFGASHNMAPPVIFRGTDEDHNPFHIERYERRGTAVVDVGRTLTREQAINVGLVLGQHLHRMTEGGILYDLSKRTLTHTRISIHGSNTDVHFLDWSNNIPLTGKSPGEVDKILVNQFRNIAVMCSAMSYVNGPLIWQGFVEGFTNGFPEIAGDAKDDRTEAILRGHRARLWAGDIIRSTEYSLMQSEDQRSSRYWFTFMRRSHGVAKLAKREQAQAQQQKFVLSELIHNRVCDIDPSLESCAIAISSNVSDQLDAYNEKLDIGKRIDSRRMGVKAETVDYDGRQAVAVRLSTPEPKKSTFAIYHILVGEGLQDMYSTSQAGVGPNTVIFNSPLKQVVVKGEYHPLKHLVNATADMCESIGEKTAVLLARAARRGYSLNPDFSDNILVQLTGDVSVRAKSAQTKSTPNNLDEMSSQIRSAAIAFKSLSHGDVAWKVFSNTLPYAANSKDQEVFLRTALRRAMDDLSGGDWDRFFSSSETVMWDNPEATTLQTDFLDYRYMYPPSSPAYSEKNAKYLAAIEPSLRKIVDDVRSMGLVDCPWRSIPRLQLLIPKKDETEVCLLADLRLGNVDFTNDFAVMLEPNRYEWFSRPRNQDLTGTRFIIPVRNGKPGKPVVLTQQSMSSSGYIAPAGLEFYLHPTGKDLEYGLYWDKRIIQNPKDLESLSAALGSRNASELLPSETEPHEELLARVQKQQELCAAWSAIEPAIISGYDEKWWEILTWARQEYGELLDFDKRYSFVVGNPLPPQVTGKISRGLSGALNPHSPKFLEDELFPMYAQIPDVLDATIENNYPSFKENVESFLTMQKMMPQVLEREAKLGRRLNKAEFQEAFSHQPKVKLLGDKPHECICGIRYLRNLSRYVVSMDLMVKGEKDPRTIVIKLADLSQDFCVSNICEVLGHRTSRSWPAAFNWGIEEFIPGKTLLDSSQEISSNLALADRMVFQAGEYAADVINFPLIPHAGNFILGKDNVLIDLEIERLSEKRLKLYPDLGDRIGWAVLPLLRFHPKWRPTEDSAGSMDVWRKFKEGMRAGHDKYTEERDLIRTLVHEGTKSGDLKVDEDALMKRFEIPPERRLKDTVKYVLERLAVTTESGPDSSKDQFWSSLPEFWRNVASDVGLTVDDIRWSQVVDQTAMVDREVLQQRAEHILLRGEGRLEDWDTALKSLNRREVDKRPALAKNEVARGSLVADKTSGNLIRYLRDGD